MVTAGAVGATAVCCLCCEIDSEIDEADAFELRLFLGGATVPDGRRNAGIAELAIGAALSLSFFSSRSFACFSPFSSTLFATSPLSFSITSSRFTA